VVASGNLEVLVDSAEDGQSSARVRTSAAGFGDTWHALLAMFFAQHDVAMRIEINDFGASPPVVLLRLEQGLERATE
jgi:malonate decarboxylase delta subunit